jgi:hypothetical protein
MTRKERFNYILDYFNKKMGNIIYGFEDILTKRKIKRLKKELEDSYIELSKVRCMTKESVRSFYNCESEYDIINIILEEIEMIKKQIEEEEI